MNHSRDGKFFNPWPDAEPHGVKGVLRWTFERVGRKRRAGTPPAPVAKSFSARSRTLDQRITWIGHSTFLLQVGGLNFLTDPIWSQRASPFQFIGPRRISAPGVRFDDLPKIDALLISHDHYDHLDSGTVRQLRRRYPGARWFVPLGVGRWLEKRGIHNVTELDWHQSLEWRGAKVSCIPAQHFSGRWVTGRDKTLWCGWVVKTGPAAVMFAGDTALHPEFERIATEYGPLNVAILPIGAYDPRWFMQPVHMNPDDAVAAYLSIRNVNGDKHCVFIPSHWGTFVLTDEPADEPPTLLREAWATAGLPPDNCVILRPGESHTCRS